MLSFTLAHAIGMRNVLSESRIKLPSCAPTQRFRDNGEGNTGLKTPKLLPNRRQDRLKIHMLMAGEPFRPPGGISIVESSLRWQESMLMGVACLGGRDPRSQISTRGWSTSSGGRAQKIPTAVAYERPQNRGSGEVQKTGDL